MWQRLSVLRLFQYPSRFLLVAPLGASVAAAAATDVLGKSYKWLSGLALVLASLLVVFPYLFPGHVPMFSAFRPVKAVSPDETRAFGPKLNAWGMTSCTNTDILNLTQSATLFADSYLGSFNISTNSLSRALTCE